MYDVRDNATSRVQKKTQKKTISQETWPKFAVECVFPLVLSFHFSSFGARVGAPTRNHISFGKCVRWEERRLVSGPEVDACLYLLVSVLSPFQPLSHRKRLIIIIIIICLFTLHMILVWFSPRFFSSS